MKKVNKKTLIITIVAFILFVIVISIVYSYCQRQYKRSLGFRHEIEIILYEAKNNYNNNKYYGRINKNSCESDFESTSISNNCSYYIEFDDSGNVIKFYVYDDEYKYEREDKNITFDNLEISDNISKNKGFKLSCRGKEQ
jgi:hypothetical protein